MEETGLNKEQKKTICDVVRSQKKFFREGGCRDISFRLEALNRLEDGLTSRREKVLGVLESDLGKPEIEAFLSEFHFVLQEIRLVRKKLRKWLKPRRVGSPFYFWPCKNSVHREAFGTVLIIAPWNYPIQLSLAPLVAAVAAGNTVILKPSEMAPASDKFLATLVSACFREDHVQVISGGKLVTEEVLENSPDFVFFTGSTAVGRVIAEKVSRNLTPTILELGGKCPCVVDGSADLKIAARRILIGKLFNSGQTCFAPDFVAVAENVREQLVVELRELLERYPWETECARIIDEAHYERLVALDDDGVVKKGADRKEDLHLAPRILPTAHWEDDSMQEEIFGPILPIVSFSDSEDLISRLRNYSSPLALYVFSRSDDFIKNVLENVGSGSVCLNDTMKQACNLELPFGGVGGSGMGRYRGKSGIEAFTMERAITKRYFLRDVFEAVPPRKKAGEMLKKWMK